MANLADLPVARLFYYTTAPYDCSYLPGHEARSLVATPLYRLDRGTFAELIAQGFRRSGHFVYRPKCDACQACIPARLPVFQFTPNRSQKRLIEKHQELEVRKLPLRFSEEHYALYLRYQKVRHEGGGMDQDNVAQYKQFMVQSSVDSVLIEYREAGVLRMVSVIDVLKDGLSSNYTFYDPDVPSAGYGIYGVLWQIAYTRALGMPFLYIGYWLDESPKMRYKGQFKPQERFVDGCWKTVEDK